MIHGACLTQAEQLRSPGASSRPHKSPLAFILNAPHVKSFFFMLKECQYVSFSSSYNILRPLQLKMGNIEL